ncbi:MAG: AAA family ATPase [Balneola sp.]|nr:AAA family ATPase [Balneola sp.]MBE79592.1 AAA family ATPase [Balneola sp.]HBX64893.1 AAA family ATPase [Balneolaceae bacterium]|tara:strand:+ start:481 stop:1473 length:993 start_codon:yes stop_codon:yes gene_type:complete
MSTDVQDPVKLADEFHKVFHQIKKEIHKAVIGQDDIIDLLLISLFSRGHCVLVGVPGLAKTLLIRTLSESLSLTFNRIQFTPDLMPGDITGTEVIEENKDTGRKEFTFIKGPVFANILLADEINRTPPKTQAALLEGMQEYHVTTGGKTYDLDTPFFVLATQNPIEQEGTYPLPEAQLDRFMFNVWVDYPSLEEEKEIVSKTTAHQDINIQALVTKEKIKELQALVREVPVPDNVLDFAVELVSKTRPGTDMAPDYINKYMSWGAGPRASQYLILGGKARALSQGRYHVTEDDIKELAIPVLRHRIVNNYAAEAEGYTTVKLIQMLIEEG